MVNKFLLIIVAAAVTAVHAQTSYSGCHTHGSVEYCFGADGEESPITTHAPETGTGTRPTSVAATTTGTGESTAVTGCHNHGSDVYCIDGDGHEVSVSLEVTPTGELPAQYTGCHSHGDGR